MFPWTKGQLKSCGNVNTHAPGITGTLMFFLFLSRLYYASKGCFSHVCSLLIGQLGRVKHRDTALVSFVLYYSPPPCSCLCPFSCSPDHCWQQTSLPTAGAVLLFFFFLSMLLKAVVRAETRLHIQKGSLTCHFGALHAGLVSLVTGLWFLHSGWPPWAAGCRQIAVGWQISSSAPLICAVGPLA